MTPRELIDALKDRFRCDSDAQAGALIGASRQQVNDWVTGHRPMPLTSKLKAADKLNYGWVRDAILFLAPELIQKDNERAKRRVNSKKS